MQWDDITNQANDDPKYPDIDSLHESLKFLNAREPDRAKWSRADCLWLGYTIRELDECTKLDGKSQFNELPELPGKEWQLNRAYFYVGRHWARADWTLDGIAPFIWDWAFGKWDNPPNADEGTGRLVEMFKMIAKVRKKPLTPPEDDPDFYKLEPALEFADPTYDPPDDPGLWIKKLYWLYWKELEKRDGGGLSMFTPREWDNAANQLRTSTQAGRPATDRSRLVKIICAVTGYTENYGYKLLERGTDDVELRRQLAEACKHVPGRNRPAHWEKPDAARLRNGRPARFTLKEYILSRNLADFEAGSEAFPALIQLYQDGVLARTYRNLEAFQVALRAAGAGLESNEALTVWQAYRLWKMARTFDMEA